MDTEISMYELVGKAVRSFGPFPRVVFPSQIVSKDWNFSYCSVDISHASKVLKKPPTKRILFNDGHKVHPCKSNVKLYFIEIQYSSDNLWRILWKKMLNLAGLESQWLWLFVLLLFFQIIWGFLSSLLLFFVRMMFRSGRQDSLFCMPRSFWFKLLWNHCQDFKLLFYLFPSFLSMCHLRSCLFLLSNKMDIIW